jgi:hypothetical protein
MPEGLGLLALSTFEMELLEQLPTGEQIFSSF